MAEQVLGPQEPEPHIGGPGPVLQHLRVREVPRARPVVDEREEDLAALHRQHLRVLGAAHDLVVARDRLRGQRAEVVEALGLGVGKVLPGREAAAVVG